MVKIIDNFFDDVSSVVFFAKRQRYYQNREHPNQHCGKWVGMRSEDLFHIDENYYNKLVNEVQTKTGIQSDLMVMYFHYLKKTDKQDKSWFHKDSNAFKYAGVIYLSENPPENAGTTIVENETTVVENKFNRGVFYPADLVHAAMSGFGDNIGNSRLTLTVFVK